MFDTFKQLFAVPRPAAAPWSWQHPPARAFERAITGTTRRWLRSLPARRRPFRLCALYPQLANRLAWDWADRVRCAALLDELLDGRRDGGASFPAPVVSELRLLQVFDGQHRVELKPEGFWARAARLSGLS